MDVYERTRIKTLRIERYRSIRYLELHDLPPIVVLYGRNGAGKSNILRAIELVLRAASTASWLQLPQTREKATLLQLAAANASLGLRPDDFRVGDLPEISVQVVVQLGLRAFRIAGVPDVASAELTIAATFQLVAGGICVWFPTAALDGQPLVAAVNAKETQALAELVGLRRDRDQNQRGRDLLLARADRTAQDMAQLRNLAQIIASQQARIQEFEARLGRERLMYERITGTLLPHLLHMSPPYRVPGQPGDPEQALFAMLVSEEIERRSAARRLDRRLARAGLFGVRESVALAPVVSSTYGENQVRLVHPRLGELSIRNLGTGEQQVVYMLAERVVTARLISLLEEPEAHLHESMMRTLARVLYDAVHDVPPGDSADVDQLWIATHHRHFSIANQFLDVAIVDGETQARFRPIDEAAEHFYEPQPYWDTLRLLVARGDISPDSVIHVEADGTTRTARELLDAVSAHAPLAENWARAATRAFVASLVRDSDS